MKIQAHEAMSLGIWVELCELKGLNIFAINEGLMEADEEIELSADDMRELGLLTKGGKG